MESQTNAIEPRPLLSTQPAKGIAFTLLSCVAGALLWALLRGPFSLDYPSATLVFTVCIVWFWQLAWSFGGWPASLWTEDRWVRGAINWILLMLVAWLTIKGWEWWFDKPFAETDIGLWGLTALFGGVLSLFFFGNRLLLPEGEGTSQPLAGLTNLIWALGFLPLVFLFLPKLAGLDPIAVPYIWFPIALIPLTYFGGQPFDRLGHPYAGFAYAGLTFIGTVVFAGSVDKAGIDFFAATAEGGKGNILVATWTNVGLDAAWLFNMWPIGQVRQPLKGILATLGTLAVSLGIYAILVGAFDAADYPAVIFGQFCFLWAQVSFAGIGLFDVFTWGYEDDPGGPGRHREPAGDTATSWPSRQAPGGRRAAGRPARPRRAGASCPRQPPDGDWQAAESSTAGRSRARTGRRAPDTRHVPRRAARREQVAGGRFCQCVFVAAIISPWPTLGRCRWASRQSRACCSQGP